MSRLSLLLLLSLCATSSCTCPPSWTAWRSSCYVFISQRLQWLEAASLCMVFGGHLAEINSRDENIFVRNMISSHNVFFSWLGINDIARDGQWVLSSSGQPLTYWNWVAGEPNNAHGVTEACGGMYRDGRWNDDECVRSRTFTSVCERPQESTDTQ
ncbi:perlucin-like protein [Pomacea canaliculata]|uniref:perlucin-like protein n=1 Tax=Pomacea canaliculata TaxID=400727 RepID=UPI000D72BBDB|nr:perlucin-like protein [Pomacea canaliculata]